MNTNSIQKKRQRQTKNTHGVTDENSFLKDSESGMKQRKIPTMSEIKEQYQDLTIAIITAFDDHQCIGKGGEIPWHIQEELTHFKDTTEGHPVIMGRKTFENILDKNGEPLPNRYNIVLSRDNYFEEADVVVENIEGALQAIPPGKKVFIAGGESVYEQFLPLADEMIISKIDGDYGGHKFFPPVDFDKWNVTSRQMNNEFSVIEYER
jgi:dihydrofolate reductase